ncbi:MULTISPECIES: lysine-sensitive aspartokinase 3 [unclassified Salinivibrio]|uniref:lysine-sensitive aspartokinase 3 n=1 Tax=unclassified Salinivibrio TaxID=2636825 RepID=UPI000984564A|nr:MULTISPECIES: lysine-sensitive aspartokinase 3 [unclassified Salinivibrio]OOF09398.1 lysine-sensitive aspartokinase 3 [Salinivibrio sp. PR919]OOF13894.1 lysine-sensitive aspartokinase 3 [Salinivibrio sp. PR932]
MSTSSKGEKDVNPLPSISVAKFGGTSVGNFAAMQQSAAVIMRHPETRFVVISACAGVTNHLVALAQGIKNDVLRQNTLDAIDAIHQQILAALPPCHHTQEAVRTLHQQIISLSEQACEAPSEALTDTLVACGELTSTHLFTHLLVHLGLPAARIDAREYLKTDSQFGHAIPDIALTQQQCQRLNAQLDNHILVTQGFIGADKEGRTTTLGRGGSDYSAALFAEALGATSLAIWTDVPGIYTTDPRLAAKARPIAEISFSEASEMATFGAKVLHPSTLLPAVRQHIPVFVGAACAPEKGGTWIREQAESSPLFRAIALRRNQTMVTLTSLTMFQAYGFLANVFAILARHQISVDLITTSEVSVSLTLDQTNTQGEVPRLPDAALEELSTLCHVDVCQHLAVVALIGNEMRHTPGAVTPVFNALDTATLRMICYGASNHNVCMVVDDDSATEVVQRLHTQLFE